MLPVEAARDAPENARGRAPPQGFQAKAAVGITGWRARSLPDRKGRVASPREARPASGRHRLGSTSKRAKTDGSEPCSLPARSVRAAHRCVLVETHLSAGRLPNLGAQAGFTTGG